MSKYDPLRDYLARRTGSTTTLLLDEITAMIPGGLPRSAYSYEAWWNNDDDTHSHCRSWGDAGFYARPNLATRRVRFDPR
jgi:hypothetical protein